ncbi:hypothetical protein [Crocosphaera sp.]|uniref:hypothetical protein n=1 Tax=Crocosphaera sp. TaxID=2729996 RepID=UPI003F20DA43|nr:hypothetical protein [Crocosphaera sp.]
MSQSLADFLNENNVDTDTVQLAALYYLAELTDYLTPEAMRNKIVEDTGNEARVEQVLTQFQNDSLAVTNVALILLSSAWNSSDAEAEKIKEFIEDAQGKCAITPTQTLAIAAVAIVAIITGGATWSYNRYLETTGGVTGTKTETIENPDGTTKYVETKEYEGFAPPLEAASKLVESTSEPIKNTAELLREAREVGSAIKNNLPGQGTDKQLPPEG